MEEEWCLDAAAVTRFTKMFADACAAQGSGVDMLGKAEAGAVLSMSGLPVPMLLQIWSLADVDGDDRLDLKEYLLCCWLVQRTVQKKLPPPITLPPQLLKSATTAVGPAAAGKPVADTAALSRVEAQSHADADAEAVKADAEAKARAEATARAQVEAAATAAATAATARTEAEAEEKARAQAGTRTRAVAEMAEAEAGVEVEVRARAEAVAAKARAEAEAKAQAEAQAVVAVDTGS